MSALNFKNNIHFELYDLQLLTRSVPHCGSPMIKNKSSKISKKDERVK